MADHKRPEILAYYFPNWHVDPRNEIWHGKGWTEWNVAKYATPRFPGHHQPKIPLWGYEDEADPAVMAKKIDAAADHGIDGFIFDWYYYDDAPYRQRCLEEGFMRAANLGRTKFAVMWCNHDAIQAHPGCVAGPRPVLASGAVTPEIFRRATQYCIDHYFANPSYLRVKGKLFYSVYLLPKMVKELGGPAAARALFDDFRERVREAGLGELHFTAVYVGSKYRDGKPNTLEVNELTAAVGLDSRTAHCWDWSAHQEFPCVDYATVAAEHAALRRRLAADFALPYNPVVMPGFDSSPRTVQSDVYSRVGYPFVPILCGSTPAAFERVLREARSFVESAEFRGDFLTIHSFNEWTEGTCLEPDEEFGFGYLEAIRNVFGVSRS